MLKRLTLIVATLALAACATEPVPLSHATKAPSERVTAFQDDIPNAGTIIVTRDSGFIGSACFYGLSINGKLAARLNPGETASFKVPAGEVLLRTGRDPDGNGLCALDSSNWTERETILKAAERKLFRMTIDVNGKLDIQRTDE
jgi:hypothetical protein